MYIGKFNNLKYSEEGQNIKDSLKNVKGLQYIKGLRQEKYSITQKKGLTPKTTSLHCMKKGNDKGITGPNARSPTGNDSIM
jgi:hypothetical protein